MTNGLKSSVVKVCRDFSNNPKRLMDILLRIRDENGCVSDEAVDFTSELLGMPRVEVKSVAAFYSFLSRSSPAKITIRLCCGVSCEMNDAKKIVDAFRSELGVEIGQVAEDGGIALEKTSCMGMCDQGPAALVNGVIVTRLTTDSVKAVVRTLRETGDPAKLVKSLGDGRNASSVVQAMVDNNIRKKGQVIFAESENGIGLEHAVSMNPQEVIRDIKTARLRGRGGAGFPTGMKWDFTRQAEGSRRYVLCNADEGEPGTFKDRALLTERPDMLIEGMTIAGYAIGAEEGVLYLRGEYAYLLKHLEKTIKDRREAGLLGSNAGAKRGFNFDVRVQLGAGAYICGEETALINSCEGLRGEPRDRPPFPAQRGYLDSPTIVNNVETFCCVTRILDKGAAWFAKIGSQASSGTKLFSISGDCKRPGVYEMPYGITISELLDEIGGSDAAAVQIGGPSGQCVGPDKFGRTICYDDMATGGSIIVFGKDRDIIDIASQFMDFFIEESCGWCVPCRAGNVLIKSITDKIVEGNGEPEDLANLEDLCKTVKTMSRCGLGQTSPNPVLTTLTNFRSLYEKRVHAAAGGMRKSFDLVAATGDALGLRGAAQRLIAG